MELSHNARAFSIASLLSTSYKIEKDDRDPACHRSAEINSHSSGPKPPGTESVGTGSSGPAGPSQSMLSDPTDYSLVQRSASLLRGISMHEEADEGMADYHPPSSLPPVPPCRQGVPLTILNIVDQRSVRPKVQSTGCVYPEEGILGSGSKQKAWVDRYPNESHGAPSERRFHLGADYMLTDPPCPVQHPPIQDADLSSARDRYNTEAGVDQPISKCVDGIRVTLDNSELWKMFNKCGTEMIVNRIGRRMFPCVVVKLTGMDPMALYRVQMELNASDRCRYKFISGKWVAVGRADSEHPNALFEPSGSPSSGAFWMKDRVSFAKLKITNNKENGGTNTVLHSMHRYTPRIIITKLKRSSPANVRGIAAPCSDTNLPTKRSGVPHPHRQLAPGGVDVGGGGRRSSCFEFEDTSFIAVTAYHSEQITQLKIHNNPFAKAFRDADVTAMLQNSYVQSEPNESTIASTCRRGLIPSMQPWSRTASMEWHTSSTTFQNQLDPNVAEYYPSSPVDTQYWRGRGPVNVPEFPDRAPWSFDNVAALRPSGIYAHAAALDAEASSQGLGHLQYRSHPDMIFDTLSKSRTASLGRHRHSTGEFQQDAFQLAKLNQSLSHPEIKLEEASTSQVAPPTHRAISKFPELMQAVTDNTRLHHPLRRGVSSAAVNRAAKRHSLPYFSPKKTVYIPRYGSADKATFEKSNDQYTDIPRRHSIVSGLPFFRASTGNLLSKTEGEHLAICGPRAVLSPTSKV